MAYSIGEVSSATGIPISTLRYYDREGFFPNIERKGGGIRVFSDIEVGAIKTIECLKTSGLSIKDIKQFMDWCQEGDSSLQERCDMFYERLDETAAQMEILQKTINMLKYKCWYYDTAIALKGEQAVRELPEEKMSNEILKYKNDYYAPL